MLLLLLLLLKTLMASPRGLFNNAKCKFLESDPEKLLHNCVWTRFDSMNALKNLWIYEYIGSLIIPERNPLKLVTMSYVIITRWWNLTLEKWTEFVFLASRTPSLVFRLYVFDFSVLYTRTLHVNILHFNNFNNIMYYLRCQTKTWISVTYGYIMHYYYLLLLLLLGWYLCIALLNIVIIVLHTT